MTNAQRRKENAMSLYTAPSGDFTPYVKYNAKAGRWYCKKDGEEAEVQNPVFVADFANVKKAWMYFMEGQAPDVVYFPDLVAQVEKPGNDHKLGLSLSLFSNDAFGGVVKMETCSSIACGALSDLYDLYEKAAESGKGQLPVVAVKGSEPIKGQFGTNYKPVFEIVKWVDRPAEFDGGSAPAESAPSAPPPAATSTVSEF